MIIKTLDIRQSEERYNELCKNGFVQCFDLPTEYEILRKEVKEAWAKNKQSTQSIKKYKFDLLMARDIYLIFEKKFDDVTLSSYDFWRYISIYVMPDLIYERWGESILHFFKKTVRIYPFTLFWYIRLSWQGTLELTFNLLDTKNCTTDTILQCVERPGKKGVNIEYFNCLMRLYCKANLKGNQSNIALFRKVLTLNTARSINIVAQLYEGGIHGYVKDLLIEAQGGKNNG